MFRFGRLMVLALVAILALAGCGAGTPGNSGNNNSAQAPTATTAPTATSAPTERPIPTPEPKEERPTATTETSGNSGGASTDDLETYTATEGDYSISYPAGWTVEEDAPNVQFLEPDGKALVQVTYSDIGGTLSNEELANIASDSMKGQFADKYEETGRVPQQDESIRIDFLLHQEPQFDGRIFVEQRGTGFYMLMILVQSDEIDNYAPVLEEVIASYSLPEKTTSETTSEDPQQRVENFFADLASAMSDPDLDDEMVQANWARQLASYFPPEDRETSETEMKATLAGLGESITSLKQTGSDLRLQATIQDLQTELASEQGDNAEVRVTGGTMLLEIVGADAESLPAEQRRQEQDLTQFASGSETIPLVRVDDVWYLEAQ